MSPSASAPPAEAPADQYSGPPLLFGGRQKLVLGGYGGVKVAYTHMLHRDGALVGGEGAMLIDHRLSLGGAGYGFTRTPPGDPTTDGKARHFVTGYGGVMVRYAVYSTIPVYASVGVLIGGGALSLTPRNDDHPRDRDVRVRGYFVAEPDLALHVNATRWLRFTLTGGYRLATSVDDFGYGSDAMSGAVVGGAIEMGWF